MFPIFYAFIEFEHAAGELPCAVVATFDDEHAALGIGDDGGDVVDLQLRVGEAADQQDHSTHFAQAHLS